MFHVYCKCNFTKVDYCTKVDKVRIFWEGHNNLVHLPLFFFDKTYDIGSSLIWTCRISNICYCILQASAVEKSKTNIQNSIRLNRCITKDISSVQVEDMLNFCGLLRISELYLHLFLKNNALYGKVYYIRKDFFSYPKVLGDCNSTGCLLSECTEFIKSLKRNSTWQYCVCRKIVCSNFLYICSRQRENRLRGSLEKFITLHKARTVYLWRLQ